MNPRRPRLAQPFTVLTQPDTVRLVAGEDHRYTLRAPGLEGWLPGWLTRLDGVRTLPDLLSELSVELREQAGPLVERLYGERVLVDGSPAAGPVARGCTVRGAGALAERLRSAVGHDEGGILLLAQDGLDLADAIAGQREARHEGLPFLWASHAALSRAYVGPLFLPDAGPCLNCLLRAFRRLSPAPELYDALLEHAGPFEPAPLADEVAAVVEGLVRWKLAQAAVEYPAAGLYRLHALERATMEVTSHRVFVDPECPVCRA